MPTDIAIVTAAPAVAAGEYISVRKSFGWAASVGQASGAKKAYRFQDYIKKKGKGIKQGNPTYYSVYKRGGKGGTIHGVSTSSHEPESQVVEIKDPPVFLQQAAMAPDGFLKLAFADRTLRIRPGRLERHMELPSGLLKWATARASGGGDELVVDDRDGEPFPVASATVRCIADPGYAQAMKDDAKTVRFSEADMDEHRRLDPPRWDAIVNPV